MTIKPIIVSKTMWFKVKKICEEMEKKNISIV